MLIVDELEKVYGDDGKSMDLLYKLKKLKGKDYQDYLRELIITVDEIIGEDEEQFNALSLGGQKYLDSCLEILQSEEESEGNDESASGEEYILPDFPDTKKKEVVKDEGKKDTKKKDTKKKDTKKKDTKKKEVVKDEGKKEKKEDNKEESKVIKKKSSTYAIVKILRANHLFTKKEVIKVLKEKSIEFSISNVSTCCYVLHLADEIDKE